MQAKRRTRYKMENRADYTLLHLDQPEELAAYARARGWLLPAESVCGLGRAGEGNMNLTLRVQTEERSFILKQARPWVEKYPDIPAPKERVLVEAAFYQAVADCPLVAERMPGFLGWDEENFVAAFADLGETADCTDLYNDGGGRVCALAGLCASGWRPCIRRRLTSRPESAWKTAPCASSTTSICIASRCARTTASTSRRDHAWAGAGRPGLAR